jgi:drug/metabolite transporter (DMT)-like permease
MSTPTSPGTPTAHLVIAFIAIYLIWGSTYLGMAIAIETMPPFLMGAVRFAVAGALLFAIRRWLGDPLPTLVQWRSAAIVGALLFVGGNGVVAWGQHWVPSGVAALLVTATPFWMTVVPWALGEAPRPTALVLAGISMGLVGVAVLVGSPGGAVATPQVVVGSLAILAASLSWALGSLCAKRLPLPGTWMSSATQMLCGAVGLGLAGLLGGEAGHLEATAISLRSWLALAYLVFVGAMLGFGAYVYLLKHTTMARVSTYAFVNPVVAVLLGWWILDEPLGVRVLAATALIAVGVALIVTARAPASEKEPAKLPQRDLDTAGEQRVV